MFAQYPKVGAGCGQSILGVLARSDQRRDPVCIVHREGAALAIRAPSGPERVEIELCADPGSGSAEFEDRRSRQVEDNAEEFRRVGLSIGGVPQHTNCQSLFRCGSVLDV